MRKVLEYEQHAAECRQMAAHQIKNPQQKSNSKTWPMCGTGSRVRVDQGIVENNPDQAQPKLKNSILREHQLFERDLLVGGCSVAGSDFSTPCEWSGERA
jgi:hypothetical protein